MPKVQIENYQLTTEEIEFDVSTSEDITSGKVTKIIKSKDYQIALFPVTEKPNVSGLVRIVYNTRINLKATGISFSMQVRRFLNDNTLVAGNKVEYGKRAVILEQDKVDEKKYHDRMSIPLKMYNDIIGIIRTVDSGDYINKEETDDTPAHSPEKEKELGNDDPTS